jgi:hypothetical protein
LASIYKEIVINVSPEQVWSVFRDIGAVHQRLLPSRVSDTRIEGDIRILTFPGGNEAREHIVTIDDERHRLAYSVIESSMPLVHHHASFQVFDADDNCTRLVWITDILPNMFAEDVRLRVEYGILDMKQTIEEQSQQ